MIGFFPKPYDDELAYSVFARYYVYSGYTSYSSAAEDLFQNPKCKPNMELCNSLTDAVIDIIGSREDYIMNHTMINYYSAFMPPDKQNEVMRSAISMDIKTLTNLLPVPKSRYFRYMRYCPMCVQEDRIVVGEAYWHRSHQMYGISVCYKHNCRLIDSSVPITSSASPILITAEESIGDRICDIEKAREREVQLARYAFELLSIKPNSNTGIGEYLKYRLKGTKYLSSRGASRNMKTMMEDFLSYYEEVDLLEFNELWQLEKVLSGKRFNPYENCLLAMFLNICPADISVRYITDTCNPVSEFDKHIKELRSKGLDYRQISIQMGISYDYCKQLGKGLKSNGNHNSNHGNCGAKRIDWGMLDIQTLPSVEQLIDRMSYIGDQRPQRLSIGYVERVLGLKEGQLSHLSKCTAYLSNHIVSQEEHWARCIAWAVNRLNTQNKPVHITNIQKLTNIRKRNLKKATPYLNRYLEENILLNVLSIL